jgi:carbonic anhydrase
LTAPNLSATDALRRLQEGNDRFVANVRSVDAFVSHTRRADLLSGQRPLAIILGCSDSRVPAEIIFDQGLGDLFVVRVAGNIVAPSLVGSIELAATRLGTRLVVVLGHSRCGAILATLADLRHPSGGHSPNLRAIVDRIRPAVEPLLTGERAGDADDEDALVRAAVQANIRASAAQLRAESEIISGLIREDGLLVVGAEYSLETGAVEFIDGAAARR